MKKLAKLLIPLTLAVCIAFGAAGCNGNDQSGSIDDLKSEIAALEDQLAALEESLGEKIDGLDKNPETPTENALAADYGAECYEKLQYIDSVISERDCMNGENFKLAQNYISWTLLSAGYSEDDIVYEPFTFTKYVNTASATIDEQLSAAKSYTTDGKKYSRSGWSYVEDEAGTYVKAEITSENIVVTKQGSSDKQIIVGAHYDGDGTGDNGSGIALALTTAEKLFPVDTTFTIVFVFFSAEEIGLYGSSAYADSMTDAEVANTLYMINIDSVVCGDYCYLYGGVQNNETKTVEKTEAYDNAMAVAQELGLSFKSNPWTWDNLSPYDQEDGAENPSYAAPSTGDWSDHVGFKEKGIPYLYFEATNWEIPDYTGYGETYLIGMLMNTQNDYLEYIEKYFPGRPLAHLTQFSALLNALVTQTEWPY